MVKLLAKMQLSATHSDGMMTVSVPITRADILHPCDIAEDVAIAYGFNRIPRRFPPTNTVGEQQPINHLTDLLRFDLANAGYMEVLTLGLCSHDENFGFLNKEDDGETAVVLGNPKTVEFQVARTSLLQGILKTIKENKDMPFKKGVRLFEISDVVLLSKASDVGHTDIGAINRRKVCAVYTGMTDGFEYIHGVVDRVMQCLGAVPTDAYAMSDNKRHPKGQHTTVDKSQAKAEYQLRHGDNGTFLPGRCVELVLRKEAEAEGTVIGHFGVLHPSVLNNFELKFPASALEMDLEVFLGVGAAAAAAAADAK